MNLFPRDSLFDFWPLMERRREHSDEAVNSLGMPRIDIVEQQGHYLLSADLPGVKKEDVAITLADGVLRIEARRRQQHQVEDNHFIRKERHEGVFIRNIEVGDGLTVADIDAHFDNGVLSLTLPKLEPKQTVPDRVEVH